MAPRIFNLLRSKNSKEGSPDVSTTGKKPVLIFLPRLDLPWGERHQGASVPLLEPSVLELRLHWKEFTSRLANACEFSGVPVRILEIPNNEITPQRVDAEQGALAFIPHRCKLNFTPGKTPVLFYMQEYFRWCFIVDKDGWSAASSRYPFTPSPPEPAGVDRFDHYRQELSEGRLSSKFKQAEKQDVNVLRAAGALPDRPFIFFPLQIPHDQSIQFFSDYQEMEVVSALVDWCRNADIPLVLKPHPANMKSCIPFRDFACAKKVYWSEAHVYDLIEASRAVYTINSGVGFESLFQAKPVVTFGRVPYDCVTYKATPSSLDAAWHHCVSTDQTTLSNVYREFINWFFNCYVYDLENPIRVTEQFLELAGRLKSASMQADG